MLCFIHVGIKWGGTGRRKGAGGGKSEGGDRESKGGGNREKLRTISQHFVTFCNRNETNRREPPRKGREAGVKGTGSGRFTPRCSHPQ